MNPSPRPALRKAPDSHIHPALALGPPQTIDLREAPAPAGAMRAQAQGPAPDDLSRRPVLPASPSRKVSDDAAGRDVSGSKKAAGKKSKSSGTAKAKGKSAKPKRDAKKCKAHAKKGKGAKGKSKEKRSSEDGDSKKRKADLKQARRIRRELERIDVRAQISPEVRKRLRADAKARGTRVDGVVTSVMEGWSPR